MESQDKAIKTALQRRQLEIQLLIRQMKLDQLYNSRVYKNLEQELTEIKSRLENSAEVNS
jgi:hypothetical protein